MLDQSLAAAFIDLRKRRGWAAQRVLGVKLRPFNLWHRFLLKTLDSPVFAGGAVGLRELRVAVGVCRLRFPNSRAFKPPPGAYFLRHGLQGEVDRFFEYCGDYISRPDWAVVPPPTRGNDAPAEPRGVVPEDLRLVADLVAWSHWPEAVVWELPIGRAYWYQMMAQRAAGLDVDFLDEEEREFQAQLKAGRK